MPPKDAFLQEINQGYQSKGEFIELGAAIYNMEPIPGTLIRIPLKTLNRHGLIAGATGTGKTKTLQGFAEALSDKSIPVLMMDIKGDLSGMAQAGQSNPKIDERHAKIGFPWQSKAYPVELLSLSLENGARLRATVSEFGPVLLSKILELSDAQAGIMSLIFKYCDDQQYPLLDLKDLKKILQYITNEGKSEIEKEYGKISSASTGTILRKIIEIEQQGADLFFGERSFEVEDLLRINENGQGYISLIRVVDIQNRPKLFSTFMLCLLAEIYQTFPEEGDLDQPKLIIMIDEAHLIFKEASRALLEQIEAIIKLIRSKGVGIFFCTQNPTDIPASILGQLGLKIQHALRAFTANDRKMIKLTAQNYPLSEYYQTEELLTSLGIGEAVVTALNEKGAPTPLAATLLRTPQSRMDVLSQEEIEKLCARSSLVKKYNETIDRESAYEILTDKLGKAAKATEKEQRQQSSSTQRHPTKRMEKSAVETVMNSPIAKQVGRTLVRELARGFLGVLGIGGRRR